MSKFNAAVLFSLVLILVPAATASAALINTYGPSNITVTVSEDLSIGLKGDMVNGNGFSGTAPNFTDADSDTVPEHINSSPIANDMWLDASGNSANAWAAFDLGSVYSLEKMRVWNYNQSSGTYRGVNSAKIYYSTLASPGLPAGDSLNPALSGWTQLGSGSVTFTQATGLTNYDAINDVSFGNVSVRHVLIDIESNFPGTDQAVGLSEVQFFNFVAPAPVPEPSTCALLAIALGVFNCARRRQR